MAKPMTLLIIDDEELVRRHLRLYVEAGGFRALEAADGRAGLALVEEQQPDLVLTDLRMPVLDGFGVIAEVQERFPDLPVIVISGTADVQEALAALRSGAWDYIVKPVQDQEAFDVVLKRALERRRLIIDNRRYQNSLEEMVKERTRDLLMLSQVAQQSPVCVMITDALGHMEYVNPQFCQASGYTPVEVLGRNPRMLKSEVTLPELHRQLWETISAGRVWEGELHNRRKNGDIYLVHSIISAIRDSDGVISHYMAIQEDTTEKMKLAEEARQAQAKLIQADKLSSLGLLVSGIAHEINNPNNFIMRNSELLTGAWDAAMPVLQQYYREHGDYNLGDFQFSEAEEILPRLFAGLAEGSRRIRNIVEKLRNFARQDRGSTRDPFDVNRVILDAIGIMNHEIKKNCERFQFEASHDLPMAMGNAQQIEQVVINLVMNSLQALPDRNCAIRIDTALAPDGQHIQITVQDEGGGWSPRSLSGFRSRFSPPRGKAAARGLASTFPRRCCATTTGRFATVPARGRERRQP